MNYKLAKELKDAGFKLEARAGVERPGEDWFNDHRDVWERLPTLSELIEACGEGFEWLAVDELDSVTFERKKRDGWVAGNLHLDWVEDKNPDAGLRIHGATPEEAVARLWLALNKETIPQGEEKD